MKRKQTKSVNQRFKEEVRNSALFLMTREGDADGVTEFLWHLGIKYLKYRARKGVVAVCVSKDMPEGLVVLLRKGAQMWKCVSAAVSNHKLREWKRTYGVA